MKKLLLIIAAAACLCGCSNPKPEPPKDWPYYGWPTNEANHL